MRGELDLLVVARGAGGLRIKRTVSRGVTPPAGGIARLKLDSLDVISRKDTFRADKLSSHLRAWGHRVTRRRRRVKGSHQWQLVSVGAADLNRRILHQSSGYQLRYAPSPSQARKESMIAEVRVAMRERGDRHIRRSGQVARDTRRQPDGSLDLTAKSVVSSRSRVRFDRRKRGQAPGVLDVAERCVLDEMCQDRTTASLSFVARVRNACLPLTELVPSRLQSCVLSRIIERWRFRGLYSQTSIAPLGEMRRIASAVVLNQTS